MAERPIYREALSRLNMSDLPEKVENLLDEEFDGLFTERRKKFILGCIRKRLWYFNKAVTL